MPHRLESLLWAIMTECAYSSPRECCHLYCSRIISVTTDQGVEATVAACPRVNLEDIVAEAAAELGGRVALDQQAMPALGDEKQKLNQIELEDELSLRDALSPNPGIPVRDPERVIPDTITIPAIPAVAAVEVEPVPSSVGNGHDLATGKATDLSTDLSTEAEVCSMLFENAFLIHGIKHICDNLLKGVLHNMKVFLVRAQ